MTIQCIVEDLFTNLASPKHVGVPHALQGGGPEPAADVVRLEPGRVATVNLNQGQAVDVVVVT